MAKMTPKNTTFKDNITHFCNLLDQADAVLVGAGSGLSADAGLDYADSRSFVRKYPAMAQYGFTTNAQLMGLDPSACPGLFWGYYLTHANNMRFCNSQQPVYRRLLNLVRQKDYFIITTNTDALFLRNGFAQERIYTPQGDYGRIQCLRPFSDETWPSEPVIKGLLPMVDPLTGKLPEEFVPSCPTCAGPVSFNLRLDARFVDSPYKRQSNAYKDWIQTNKGRRLLLIDIGTGFHTPVWIRRPFEKITFENPGSHLIRINTDDPQVPDSITHRSTCFPNRAIQVINAITDHLNKHRMPIKTGLHPSVA